jgi:hypothetical protein
MQRTFIPTLSPSDFAVALTERERELVENGKRDRDIRRGEGFTERTFEAMSGKRSYKRRRGEWRVFA